MIEKQHLLLIDLGLGLNVNIKPPIRFFYSYSSVQRAVAVIQTFPFVFMHESYKNMDEIITNKWKL